MMYFQRLSSLAIITLFTLFVADAKGFGESEAIGRIEKAKGRVTVQRVDGQAIVGETGNLLFPGDEITTGKESTVLFSLKQGGEYKLEEDANVSVDELTSSQREEHHSILRLVLGHLWAKIQKPKGDQGVLTVHTPTAIVGVRGTEFETVVALDAASVIIVDEGRVEVEAAEEKVLLVEGRMTQVETAAKPALPVEAIPKEKRDWRAWRKERVKRLFKNLPKTVPKFRNRFERAVKRSKRFTDRVSQKAELIRSSIDEVRRARKERDRQRAVQSIQQLRADVQQFKKMVVRFRRGMNRVRVMGKLSHRVERFVSREKERFSRQDLDNIESNLAVIAQKRLELREIFRGTIPKIKRTFRELMVLKKEIRTRRERRG